MGTYALINVATGIVEMMIDWDGNAGWAPEDGYIVIESYTAAAGWLYVGGELIAPPPPPVIPPTPQEILEANTGHQSSLITSASQAMAPILVSLQLGDATDAETLTAKAWQTYYRALQAVDLTVANPAWPTPPAS